MANTQIQISADRDGSFIVTPQSAPFNTGDTVLFLSTEGTPDALVCLSDDAADIVTPSPNDPVPLAGGAVIEFTVTGAAKPGCGAEIAHAGHGGDPNFAGSPSGLLQIAIVKGRPVPPIDSQN